MGMTPEERRKKSLERHTVICPYCGGKALDHMTQCPSCGEAITPKGYTPMMDDKTQRRVKLVLAITLSVVAVVLLIILAINR